MRFEQATSLFHDTPIDDCVIHTDCGVPSAFDEALECDNCTMCCKYYCYVAVAHFDSLNPQLLTSIDIASNY